MGKESLLYLSQNPLRDRLDSIIDWYFYRSVRRVETRGTERNIPLAGPLVVGFAPHTGWLEVFVIDHFLRKARASKQGAVWITKTENAQTIPHIIRGDRRLLFVDRDNPTPQLFKTAGKVLDKGGVIGSSLEGTRYGNPSNPEDIFTLAPFKPGLVHIAQKAKAPIIPAIVLGVEQVIPSPEKVKEKSKLAVAAEVTKEALKGGARIELRFLPPYTNHLQAGNVNSKEVYLDELGRVFAGEIVKIRPDYPLGPYASSFSQGSPLFPK